MRPFFFYAFILLFTSACITKKADISSGSINASAPFVWESSFPKSIYVSSDYDDPTEQQYIDDMLNAWETAVNGKDFFTNSGTETEKTHTIKDPAELRDGKFVIYRATNWPYPKFPDALAITQIFALRHNVGDADEFLSILEADVIMNYENFRFFLDTPDPYYLDYDFRTVLLHELGHFLGLQHKPKTYNRNNTVMYPTIFSDEVKQEPKTIDKQDLAEKYGIALPLKAGGSALAAQPKNYQKRDKGEMTQIILELKANGDCVHHMDGAIVSRHRMQ